MKMILFGLLIAILCFEFTIEQAVENTTDQSRADELKDIKGMLVILKNK